MHRLDLDSPQSLHSTGRVDEVGRARARVPRHIHLTQVLPDVCVRLVRVVPEHVATRGVQLSIVAHAQREGHSGGAEWHRLVVADVDEVEDQRGPRVVYLDWCSR